ncbi:HEAT repeat domain-containing protein [Pedobacter metabolipauper]|uniref:HEAT repeat protein n=1 Tax=Pedobacter metabolipauper TaxID=425513 RepID=A0A4R6T034_9SPHI|nr:HEAT repeat domain-containing protein [Pedobacter metabolipauper]TDQ11742.1 HEAT repeat protein [Pedobacter metabolipauper]
MSGEKENKDELDDQQMWNLLDGLKTPEPGSDMEIRFQGMLDHYKQTQLNKRSYWMELWTGTISIFNYRMQAQLAYSLILIAFSMAIGYSLSQNEAIKTDETEKLAVLANQVDEMRKMMVVSLLENPSPTERLRAVNYTGEMDGADRQVIAVLLSTLNGDPNVNVRLVTLDALAKFSDQPEVRAGLIKSIIGQESPLVQVAMANLMMRLQEKRSVTPFKKLLEQEALNNAVRIKIEHTIDKLII